MLVGGHAYSIHNAFTNESGQKMVLVRNPWGLDNQGNVRGSTDPSANTQDGFVTLTFQEFVRNFSTLSVTK